MLACQRPPCIHHKLTFNLLFCSTRERRSTQFAGKPGLIQCVFFFPRSASQTADCSKLSLMEGKRSVAQISPSEPLAHSPPPSPIPSPPHRRSRPCLRLSRPLSLLSRPNTRRRRSWPKASPVMRPGEHVAPQTEGNARCRSMRASELTKNQNSPELTRGHKGQLFSFSMCEVTRGAEVFALRAPAPSERLEEGRNGKAGCKRWPPSPPSASQSESEIRLFHAKYLHSRLLSPGGA